LPHFFLALYLYISYIPTISFTLTKKSAEKTLYLKKSSSMATQKFRTGIVSRGNVGVATLAAAVQKIFLSLKMVPFCNFRRDFFCHFSVDRYNGKLCRSSEPVSIK